MFFPRQESVAQAVGNHLEIDIRLPTRPPTWIVVKHIGRDDGSVGSRSPKLVTTTTVIPRVACVVTDGAQRIGSAGVPKVVVGQSRGMPGGTSIERN